MFWSHCGFLGNRRFVWVRALSYLRLTTFAENQIAETDERINQQCSSCRAVETSENLRGGQSVLCWTQSVPPGWDWVNWSAKIWAPPPPPPHLLLRFRHPWMNSGPEKKGWFRSEFKAEDSIKAPTRLHNQNFNEKNSWKYICSWISNESFHHKTFFFTDRRLHPSSRAMEKLAELIFIGCYVCTEWKMTYSS